MVTGAPVSKIFPGKGVQLATGEMIESSVVVANCDPQTCLKLLEDRVENSWKSKVNQVPIEGCVVKINVALSELPNFKSRPGFK